MAVMEFKRRHDTSWPICSNCGGDGVITMERAQQGRGNRGEVCSACGGIGRVPDPAWPLCRCCLGGEQAHADPNCPICLGHGRLSPDRQGLLARGAIHKPCSTCGGIGSVPA